MSSYVNAFLKTEITCIPRLFSTYLGDYYNNALCNGATWIFALWFILHSIFDRSADAFMKKLRYREYVRTRLKRSLWYLGFYGTAVVYCGATLTQNEVELFNFKKMHVPSSSSLPTQVVLGYTLIVTFYLHSSLWEGLSKGYVVNMINYLLLFTFMVSSYILRIVEISFTLTALISVVHVSLEFTRCCFMTFTQERLLSKIFIVFCYIATFLIYLTVHLIVIPLTFLLPLGLKIMTDYPNMLLMFLYFNLFFWFLTEMYHSIAFKLADHWLYHKQISQTQKATEQTEILDSIDALSWCSSTLLECSLFRPRDDDSYNFMIMREEIKARKNKMLSMRKPKNMFLQTLKCMVAIKRKLSERRLSESSDSDDSEKSENSDLKTSDNTDDEVELHSDEESDNEESDSQECDDADIEERNDEYEQSKVSPTDSPEERNIVKRVPCRNGDIPEKIFKDDERKDDLCNKFNKVQNLGATEDKAIDKSEEKIVDNPNVDQMNTRLSEKHCEDFEQCISGEIKLAEVEEFKNKTEEKITDKTGSQQVDEPCLKQIISDPCDDCQCLGTENININKDDTNSEMKVVQIKGELGEKGNLSLSNAEAKDCDEVLATDIHPNEDHSDVNVVQIQIREVDDVNVGIEHIHGYIKTAQMEIEVNGSSEKRTYDLSKVDPNDQEGSVGKINSESEILTQNREQGLTNKLDVACDECIGEQSHLSEQSTDEKVGKNKTELKENDRKPKIGDGRGTNSPSNVVASETKVPNTNMEKESTIGMGNMSTE